MLSWFSDSGLADSDSSRAKEMTAINSGMHEVPGVRLPLQTSYASPSPHAVFMYSTTGGAEGSVTLQLRDTDDLDDKSGLASVLARLQQEDATLSISYQDSEMLTEGSIDVLLGTGSLHTTGNGGNTATFDLFDSESGQDLTLSPQTFTSSTEAFINDNSDSLGVPGDTDTVGSTEDAKGVADSSKLAVKKPRPKASSPNRQGPQQCQVCGKVFGNASALAKHKLTHSDERKYVCSMCGKAFKRQDHLNGHMLTHRNKKPYECKAEGCGKSYCDARSLRRHTENHHTNNNASSTAQAAAAAASTTTSASGSATSSDDGSPLASSCIQYAPPPQQQQTPTAPPPPYPATSSPSTTSTAAAASSSSSGSGNGTKQAPSQLQQLLASEPASASAGTATSSTKASSSSQSVNNDGLTKQQLDLIHQIMQQTQQQAAAHQKQQQQQNGNSSSKSISPVTSSSVKTSSSSNKSRTWTVQNSNVGASSKANGGSNGQPQNGGGANSAGSTKQQPQQQQPQQQQQQQSQQQDPKPVECNLCHRKFKNIPALNGHMRLHGGYFKKDSESKKCEKKEVSGPPLQTASMSVRALIEEKIIQKRITNPQLQAPIGQQQQQQQQPQQQQQSQQTHLSYASSEPTSGSRVGGAPPQYPSTPPTPGSKESDLNIKLSSFVVPAPPLQSQQVQQQQSAGEKMRRHSDSEHFVSPRAPADVQQEAVALAELLLKRGGKDNLPLWLPPLMQSQPQWRALVNRSGDSFWRPGGNKGHDEVAVKRASSDPGAQHSSSSSSASPSPQPTMPAAQQQQLQLSFQGDSYSLAGVGVTYQAAEDGSGYFSPSLQEDVFQQVSVQDTMLLHGVDAAQLAETIQFQAASLLQDQATAEQLQDIASLEDYQTATAGLQDSVHSPQYNTQNHHGVPQDFQSVLDSPLPAGLADFSTYGQPAVVTSNTDIRTGLPSPVSKDPSGGYRTTQSPHQQGYANSPHAALTVQSPLPSPLTHHDSPGFTYPTPPASQEGQSPSFVHGTIMTSTLPLSSPQQQSSATDSFVQSVISHGGGHVPPASSPLSAAFYTAAMSSSAAVEAALSEVLPVETQGGCVVSSHLRSPHGFSLYGTLANPSPPPQSPLSATPVPSPLSLSSVPASSSSVSSPLPPVTFASAQGQVTFPLSPHQSLQSQMMPNSEDPLLSSSPKDFGSRKKFDFGGIHSFKLVGNGMVDFGVGNSGLTGIVVDSNGELKFFQTSNHHSAKSLVVTGSTGSNATVMMGTGTSAFQSKKTEPDGGKKGLSGKGINTHHSSHFHHHHSSTRSQRPRLQVALDHLKEEGDDDVFLSPTSIPASPIRVQRKRPRPEPLYIPPHPHPMFQSRLRSPRLCTSSPPPLYTPPPMLSPARNGQGLYWQAVTSATTASSAPASSTASWPSSTTLIHCKNGNGGESSSSDESQQGPTSTDSALESDATPHINVGSEFQCSIPQWNPDREKANREPSYEHLLWDPGISKFCTDAEVEMYLEFACCAAVPGGGRNKEYALHLLHMCHGNIHEAMLKLMQPTPTLPPGHPLLAYEYTESDRWSAEEMDTFHQGLLKFDKDFRSVAEEIGSKTVKQCIQFYYLWKKVCPEEYKRLRLIRRRQNADYGTRTDVEYEDIKMEDSRIPANDVELVSTSSESRLFVCEYPDCSASFNSRAALNGHIRIHGGGVCGRSPTPDKRPVTATPPTLGDIIEEFPCKICGKVFNKVKSRSAHMKSHRPPDAEPKKAKLDPHKMEAAEQTLGRAMGVSTTIGRHT